MTIVTIVNQIARELFHASAQTDDELVGIESLADLHAAQERSVDAVNDARPSGYSIPAACSVWQLLDRLDEDGGGRSLGWTTNTGRLDILNEQPADPDAAGFRWRLTMTANAGPSDTERRRYWDDIDRPRSEWHPDCIGMRSTGRTASSYLFGVSNPDYFMDDCVVHKRTENGQTTCPRPLPLGPVEEPAGRPVLQIAWSEVRPIETWTVKCEVRYLDSGLLVEKPERVALLVDCARRARLDLPSDLAAAIRLAGAHAEAIRSLNETTYAALNIAARHLSGDDRAIVASKAMVFDRQKAVPRNPFGKRPPFGPGSLSHEIAHTGGLQFSPEDFAEPTGDSEPEPSRE